MKTKFQVGDRVAVYHCGKRATGRVEKVLKAEMDPPGYEIWVDNTPDMIGHEIITATEKQLRRLRKVKRAKRARMLLVSRVDIANADWVWCRVWDPKETEIPKWASGLDLLRFVETTSHDPRHS